MKRTHSAHDLTLVVASKSCTADGNVAILHLERPDKSELPPWDPGAHIDIYLAPNIVRQYSLCGRTDDKSTWQIAVLRELDSCGGSAYIHETLGVGDVVQVRGPHNNFQLVPRPNYLFIAGGIGITPILPMAAHAHRTGAAWKLLYGGRTRATMAFADELCRRYPDNVTLCPQDVNGLIDLDQLLGWALPDTAVYCCGPNPLLDRVGELCARHWPPGALHVERFSSKLPDRPASNSAFEVELTISGITVTVDEDQSILDAVRASGVQVLSSCEEGTCGTCETTVLEGAVDHRDSLLTDEDKQVNDSIMICVSRARCPRLVLEL